MTFDPRDSGRVPAFRSSILQRFHPYLRLKPSIRQVLMAQVADGFHAEEQHTSEREESNLGLENLERALVSSAQENTGNIQRRRRLSSSTLVTDLALLVARKKR
ncbi:hypothetical protein F5I97DRAFT_106607 [Phlebopus sp. FC_14]|nr:hypothetical protein F5I97DRAFT_106607 [Phlebopus sp. FC_14]